MISGVGMDRPVNRVASHGLNVLRADSGGWDQEKDLTGIYREGRTQFYDVDACAAFSRQRIKFKSITIRCFSLQRTDIHVDQEFNQ